ncbi:putative LRR receptor-like serine/threonine-protein kinase At3g47570 [Nicotiana tabacum]|uniref:LRR receptor-like serine/threonine-protein kinase At3g47570 n=1 Tax=Nicotiana tabacum TaxID=4097 RepID=A0AC58TSU2_TOBAC
MPNTFNNLIVLEYLDLSSNVLIGMIPKSLELLRDLKYLNVSFNNLQGEVPKKGVFANLSYRFLMGNPRLCGAPDLHIPLCPAQGSRTTRKKSLILGTTVPAVSTFLILVALFFTWMIWSRKKHVKSKNGSDSSFRIGHQKISYYELLQATENFSQSNLLGSGSSGTVYKDKLSGDNVFAIKVFDMQWQGALKFFDSECEILSNVRHRNLVKIVSTCSNMDFVAMVLEYMPNGSLDKRLYSDRNCLSLVERLNIMIDVALAMEYLHHDYTVPIVHCDLKPANLLLDQDLIAHVADFGIAKMLAQEGNIAQSQDSGNYWLYCSRNLMGGFHILMLSGKTARKEGVSDMFNKLKGAELHLALGFVLLLSAVTAVVSVAIVTPLISPLLLLYSTSSFANIVKVFNKPIKRAVKNLMGGFHILMLSGKTARKEGVSDMFNKLKGAELHLALGFVLLLSVVTAAVSVAIVTPLISPLLLLYSTSSFANIVKVFDWEFIATEYGLDGQISTRSDVYSFGILLLETFTRKKPTDDMFGGDLSLHKWVSLSFPDAVIDILEADLVNEIGFDQSGIKQVLVSIIHVAFLCLEELPEDRINMRDVVVQLKKIRAELAMRALYRFSYKT